MRQSAFNEAEVYSWQELKLPQEEAAEEEAAEEEEEEEEEEVGGLIRTKCTTRARHVTKKSFNRT